MRFLIAAILGILAINFARTVIPYRVGHTLTEACEWRPRLFLAGLSARLGGEDIYLRAKCKGGKSGAPIIHVLMAKWPSAAERAEWSH